MGNELTWDEASLKAKGFMPDGKGGWKVGTKQTDFFVKNKNGARHISKPEIIATLKTEVIETKGGIKGLPTNNFMSIFIPGNVPSSKNSKQAFIKEKFHQVVNDYGQVKMQLKRVPGITHSKLTKAYIKATRQIWIDMQPHFLKAVEGKEKPYKLEFTFSRNSRHKFDFVNAAQIICDLMQEHKWIAGDDMDEIVPYPPMQEPFYIYNKTNPGVYIKIL